MRLTFLNRMCACSFFFLSLCVAGQNTQMGRLFTKSRISVGHEKAEDFVDPIRSDAVGNIYIRYGDGEHPAEVITKISPLGEKLSSFDLAQIVSTRDLRMIDFSPDVRGNLWVLAKGIEAKTTLYIVSLAPDGALLSKVKLESEIEPFQFAPLKGGNFAISGRRPPNAANYLDSVPFVVIADPHGHLVRPVPLAGDIAPLADGERMLTNGAPKKDRTFEMSLAASEMETADNGNVYLMRQGKSGIVFVLSSKGNLLRRLVLDTPPGAILRDLKVGDGRLAAVFIRKMADPNTEITASFIRTYVADTGRLINSYALDHGIPVLLARYDGKSQFVFFGSDSDQNLTIFNVEPVSLAAVSGR
jgi:hypothetical protein